MISLYIDLETLPDQRDGAFERYLDAVEPPGNYKKPETIQKWLAENAEAVAAENYQKTGLNGLHGEICSIAFAIGSGDIENTTRTDKHTEKDLLEEFWEMLRKEVAIHLRHGEMRTIQWTGHNVIDFDLRFLKQRSIVNGIKPAYFLPADARHGGDHVFDTMKEWAGWRGYVKQDELCETLGIKAPDNFSCEVTDLDGSAVWEMFQSEQYGLIADYNILDVWKVREIHRRMTFQ